jgi:hypothetical protein
MSIKNQHDSPHDSPHDSAELERFMRGEDELSAVLKDLAQPVPPPALDAAILGKIEAALIAEKAARAPQPEAANDAVDPANTETPPKKRFLRSWWQVPLGLAAGVLLTIAFRTQFQDGSRPDTVALVAPPRVAAVSAPPAFAPSAPPDEGVPSAAKVAASPAPAAARPATDIAQERAPRALPPLAYAPPPLLRSSPPEPPPVPTQASSAPIASGAISAPPARARAAQEADAIEPGLTAANDIPVAVQPELKKQRDAIARVEAGNRNEAAKKSENADIALGRRAADKAVAADTESRTGGLAAGQLSGKMDDRADRAARVERAKVGGQVAVVTKPEPQPLPKAAIATAAPAPEPLPAPAPISAPAPAPTSARPPSPITAGVPAPSIAEVAITSDSSARNVVPLTAGTSSSFALAPVPASVSSAENYNRAPPAQQASEGFLARREYAEASGHGAANPQNLSTHLRADAWLAVIEQKLKSRDDKGALQEWAKFRRIYPDFPVDKVLEARLKMIRPLPAKPDGSVPTGPRK